MNHSENVDHDAVLRARTMLRPLFDQGVALARRLPTAPGTLAETLTDRAMFLVAAQRYEEAHADFAAAVELRGAATSNAIVTRT